MEPTYALNEVARVIKRHTHDVRNALNGMELELALLDEAMTEPSARAAIKRLRQANGEIGRLVQALSCKFGTDPPCLIPAVQVAERWSAGARHIDVAIEWNISLDRESLLAETGLLRSLLEDLLDVAIRLNRKRPLTVHCHAAEGRVVYEINAREGLAPGNAVIEAQQAYWAALCRLAERGPGSLFPAVLTATGSFPMRLSLPIHR